MTTITDNWVGLCQSDDLADSGMLSFEIGSKRIAIYRVEDGIYATDNICSHAFALLTDGWLEDGLVECPLHGAQFDVKTGEAVRGPADCSVPTFQTRVRDGLIEVHIGD